MRYILDYQLYILHALCLRSDKFSDCASAVGEPPDLRPQRSIVVSKPINVVLIKYSIHILVLSPTSANMPPNASVGGLLTLIGNDFGEKCFRRGSPDPHRQRFRGEMLLSLCCWGQQGGNFSKSGGKVSGSMGTSTSSVTANSLTADSLEKPCARTGYPCAQRRIICCGDPLIMMLRLSEAKDYLLRRPLCC